MRSITLLCTIGISLIIVVSIFGLVHLTGNSNLNADQKDVRAALQNSESSTGNPIILNHRMVKLFFSNDVVKGQVKNKGSGKLRYATINVDFYKEGNLIYSGSANLNNIAPGEIEDFEIVYRGPDGSPDSYEINLGPYL